MLSYRRAARSLDWWPLLLLAAVPGLGPEPMLNDAVPVPVGVGDTNGELFASLLGVPNAG